MCIRDRLRTHFPMMKKWVDYIHGAGKEEYLWLDGVHYGDWLAMDAGYGVCEGDVYKRQARIYWIGCRSFSG